MTTKNESTEVSTEVTALPSLPVAYTAESLEDLYKKVEAEVKAHVPDIETVEGRKHIKALAKKVSESKTAIDKPMRDYLREIKALPKVVEKNARESVERFDALRDATLAPLNAALEPQEAIIARMGAIVSLCNDVSATSDTVRAMLDEVNAVDTTKFWSELVKKADAAVDGARQVATDALARIEAAEKQAAELERLRKEAVENAQRERDRLIAESAEKKAREEEQQRAEQRILDERNKAEQSRMAQLKAEQEAKDNEARRIAQEEQSKREREEAEQQAKIREQKAADKAAQYAREQQELEKQRAAEEAERREQDKAHRTAINRAALVDLIAHAGIDEDTAKKVITAVAMKKVSGMSVNY